MRRLLSAILRYRGWTFEGTTPPDPKVVIPAAPHTSNWDFIVFLGAAYALGIRPRFIAKHGLFRWPLGWAMRRLGGIPVRRDASFRVVEQVVAQIREAPGPMTLLITPEGTRAAVPYWKSGFYRIAEAADVPMVLGFADYPSRRAGFGPTIRASGDLSSDMDLIRAFYADKRGLHPERAGPVRLREEGRPANRA
jgi:1-acyl-sn-glycerol-3-phosphate acyltransferase